MGHPVHTYKGGLVVCSDFFLVRFVILYFVKTYGADVTAKNF